MSSIQILQSFGSFSQLSGVWLAGPTGSLAAHSEVAKEALAGVGFTEVPAGSRPLHTFSGKFPLRNALLFYVPINVLMGLSSFDEL